MWRTSPSSDSDDGGTDRSRSWSTVRSSHFNSSVARWYSSHASSMARSSFRKPGSVRSTAMPRTLGRPGGVLAVDDTGVAPHLEVVEVAVADALGDGDGADVVAVDHGDQRVERGDVGERPVPPRTGRLGGVAVPPRRTRERPAHLQAGPVLRLPQPAATDEKA